MGKGEGNTHLTTDRTRHYRDCPVCEGACEVTIRNPAYGSPNCQWDIDTEPCPNPRCFKGEVVEWEDPLLRLASCRNTITRGRTPGYYQARHAAMKPALLPPDFAVSSETAAHFNRRDRDVVMEVLGPAFAQVLGRAA